MLELEVVVDGETRRWTVEDLARVEPLSVPGDSGEGRRDAWSARTLLQALVGPEARLVEVRGDGGRRVVVPPEAWGDATRTPMLRLNRRGQIKFHWAGPDFVPLRDAEELRQVAVLEVRTR